MTAAPFWDFAVAAYGREGVAEACLSLQDRIGADVNVVLFCVWLAARGQSLTPLMVSVMAISQRWGEIVVPLRQARRRLKSLPDATSAERDAALALRERVKAAEFDAERCACLALAALVPGSDATLPPDRSRAAENLLRYGTAMNFQENPLGDGDILRILDVLCTA